MYNSTCYAVDVLQIALMKGDKIERWRVKWDLRSLNEECTDLVQIEVFTAAHKAVTHRIYTCLD